MVRSVVGPWGPRHSPAKGGTVTRFGQNSPFTRAETCIFQMFTLPLKGHKGDWATVSHAGPSEHILADADEWQELAGAQGRSPEAGRGSFTDHGWATEGSVQVPGVKADLPRTSGARARARRLPRAEDKVRSRRPRGLGTGHRARRRRGGHGLRAALTLL